MAYVIQDGSKKSYTCTGAVTNGQLILVGDLMGVALTSGTTGQSITLMVDGVVGGLAKKDGASTNWADGGQVYYMTTGGVHKLTGVAAAGKQIGTGWAAAVTGATTGVVKLIGQAVVTETQT